jgi:hypothetical protein
MLQGKYSARGGPIKGRTATLMFSRNKQKKVPEVSFFFGRIFFPKLS